MQVEPATGFVRSGKVRDLSALDGARLLLVASDRVSAFDVVLPTPIPDKGRVLTGLSRFWFWETDAAGIVPNHLLATDPAALPEAFHDAAPDLAGRMMICRLARPLPVEIIVRGYLSGSGWKDYERTGAVCGIPLSPGLRESDRLPEPLFTPSTKAEVGHDQNIDFDAVVGLVGADVAERAREIALALYRFGSAQAEGRGIILADTKFELGLIDDGLDGEALILIDEVMTPDSSRFWDASVYEPGRAQASFDKQFVRDWLETQTWDKTPPGPALPSEVVEGTRARYVEAFERITGGSFERYQQEDRIDA
ncbi:phosphoribosylaminoimidazolesuccinocarboxamide synthase [soil metagenome]